MYLCYCLERIGGRGPITYVGCTNNFDRRIRQHNAEIKGGAKCTTKACAAGAKWHPIYFARGFIDNHEALSFEWWWKHESRKIKGNPREKRLASLNKLLGLPRFAHIVKDESSNSTIADQTFGRVAFM